MPAARSLTFILLFCLGNPALAQFYLFKPYLEITDSSAKQVFRIKEEKNIKIRLKGNTDIRKTHIKEFLSDSTIALAKIGIVSLSDLEFISFKSDKGARTVRQIFYPIYMITITSYFAAYGNEINIQNSIPVAIVTFFVSGMVSLGIETVAGLVYLINNRKEFEKGNMMFKIYR